MGAHLTRNALVAAVCLAFGACATDSSYPARQVTQTTPQEAARLLGCQDDEIAFCVETNCELEEYRCTQRSDVRDLLKAGEFRHR